MSHVIYDAKTTRIVGKTSTERGAKIQRTKLSKKEENAGKELLVAESTEFYDDIEMMVTKTNLLTGKEYEEPVNTPIHMSPASETYWSM